MKQRITYSLLALLTLLFAMGALSSCQIKDSVEVEPELQDDMVQVQIGLDLPGLQELSLRSNEDDLGKIQFLKVLVFSEEGTFLYSITPSLEAGLMDAPSESASYLPADVGQEQDYTLDLTILKKMKPVTLELKKSDHPRILHFIASPTAGEELDFYKDISDDSKLYGRTEGDIMTMTTENFVYWQRLELDNISSSAVMEDKVVRMLRNMAGVQIIIHDDAKGVFKLEAYELYNTSNKGTVAAFPTRDAEGKPLFKSFPKADEPTLVPGIETVPMPEFLYLPNGYNAKDTVKFFETPHDPEQHSFIIMKGKFREDTEYCYYKIDPVKEVEQINHYVPLVRNYLYQLTIKRVASRGYATKAEALAQPAGNNIIYAFETAKYPSVSFGNRMLTVNRLGSIIVNMKEQNPFVTEVVYEKTPKAKGNGASDFTPADNGSLKIKPLDETLWNQYVTKTEFVQTDASIHGVKKTLKVTFNETAHSNINPEEPVVLKAYVMAGSKEVEGGTLARPIMFLLRPPYECPGKIIAADGMEDAPNDATHCIFFEFSKMGVDIPQIAFPYEIQVRTKDLTPIADREGNTLHIRTDSKTYGNGQPDIRDGYGYYYAFTVRGKEDFDENGDLKLWVRYNDSSLGTQDNPIIAVLSAVYTYPVKKYYPKSAAPTP